MTQHLQDLVETLVLEVLGKFNLSFFKQLAAGDVRPAEPQYAHAHLDTGVPRREHPEIGYAKKMLPFLGEGSSRIVFAYSGGKALKIAISQAGISQNLEELNAYTRQKSDIIPAIFDYSPDGKWIIAEIVKPFSSSAEFIQAVGYDLYQLFKVVGKNPGKKLQDLVQDLKDDIRFARDEYSKDEAVAKMEDLKAMLKNPKVKKVIDDLNKLIATGTSTGDMHTEHFGVNVQGDLKFYDYGLTEEIYDTHYTRKSLEPTGSEF